MRNCVTRAIKGHQGPSFLLRPPHFHVISENELKSKYEGVTPWIFTFELLHYMAVLTVRKGGIGLIASRER